jgi:hypothetical protein
MVEQVPEPSPDGPPMGRGPLIALVVIVVLVVGGVWLAQHIRAANQVQDCVMAGRTNCAPVQ